MIASLLVGAAAGLLHRSRWSMLVAPAGAAPLARPGELSPQVDRGDGPATWAVEPRPRFEETDNLAESDVAVNVTSRSSASLAGDIGRANLLARRRWIRAQEPGTGARLGCQQGWHGTTVGFDPP